MLSCVVLRYQHCWSTSVETDIRTHRHVLTTDEHLLRTSAFPPLPIICARLPATTAICICVNIYTKNTAGCCLPFLLIQTENCCRSNYRRVALCWNAGARTSTLLAGLGQTIARETNNLTGEERRESGAQLSKDGDSSSPSPVLCAVRLTQVSRRRWLRHLSPIVFSSPKAAKIHSTRQAGMPQGGRYLVPATRTMLITRPWPLFGCSSQQTATWGHPSGMKHTWIFRTVDAPPV